MVDDERLAQSERDLINSMKSFDDKRTSLEHIIQQKLQDASLTPILNYYLGKGMTYERAYRQTLRVVQPEVDLEQMLDKREED